MAEMFEDASRFEHSTDKFSGPARYRRFGDAGPAYEVLGVEGDHVRVRVIDTKEEADYRLTDALSDPLA